MAAMARRCATAPRCDQCSFHRSGVRRDSTTVARGEASDTCLQDPREFFRVTYMTDGLKAVLRNAVERLWLNGGEPVIGLQTAFGGGKTQTMLALYHGVGLQTGATSGDWRRSSPVWVLRRSA